jgi:hypothetical protein
MTRPKKLKKQVRVSVMIDEKHLKRIQSALMQISISEDKNISTSEVIRRSLEIVFPREWANGAFLKVILI